jgi:hypothetical protein
MRSVGARYRNSIGITHATLRAAATHVTLLVVRCHTKGQVSRTCPHFICSPYAGSPRGASKSYAVHSSYMPRSEPMLDLALFLGFALVCLYVAYERLCNRW